MLDLARRAARRARASYLDLKTAFIERPHYHEFERFYEGRADKHRLFYLFVSHGLLHWARKALEFIPAQVNLVVIGSSPTPAELDWLKCHVNRPVRHITLAVDDKTVWDFLFRVNRHNFGWVDSQ
jgi:hypothetical protein